MLKRVDCDTSSNKCLFCTLQETINKSSNFACCAEAWKHKNQEIFVYYKSVSMVPTLSRLPVERPQSPLVFYMAMSRYGHVPGSRPQALIWN